MRGSDSVTYVKPVDTPVALAPDASVSQNKRSVPPAGAKGGALTPRIPVEASGRSIKRRPIRIVALVIALAVVVGGIAYGLTGFSHQKTTTGAGSTSTQASTPTLGSTPIATLSPQTPSTLALTPQQIYNKYITETPSFSDPTLNNPDNLWTISGGLRSCSFTNGAYHAAADFANAYAICEAQGVALAPNFAFQVDVTIIQGDAGGLVFRSSGAGAGGYIYTYCITTSCGRKQFGLYVSSSGSTTCLGAQSCNPDCQADPCSYSNYESIINANPGATNTLTVIVLGRIIYMYINRGFVGQVTDDHFSSGAIGVAAFDAASYTDVTFHNAKVWML